MQAEFETRTMLEDEEKLKAIGEKLAGLEQRLIEQITARKRAEILLRNEHRARVEAEQKIQTVKQARNQQQPICEIRGAV
jgi:hypothetical protein